MASWRRYDLDWPQRLGEISLDRAEERLLGMEVGEDMSQEEGRCMMIQMKGRSLLDITMGETEQDA
jgi:hypothetical protein